MPAPESWCLENKPCASQFRGRLQGRERSLRDAFSAMMQQGSPIIMGWDQATSEAAACRQRLGLTMHNHCLAAKGTGSFLD